MWITVLMPWFRDTLDSQESQYSLRERKRLLCRFFVISVLCNPCKVSCYVSIIAFFLPINSSTKKFLCTMEKISLLIPVLCHQFIPCKKWKINFINSAILIMYNDQSDVFLRFLATSSYTGIVFSTPAGSVNLLVTYSFSCMIGL